MLPTKKKFNHRCVKIEINEVSGTVNVQSESAR